MASEVDCREEGARAGHRTPRFGVVGPSQQNSR
jgi:hypothetical protein